MTAFLRFLAIGLVLFLAGCTPQKKPLAPIAAKLAVLRKQPSPRPEDEFPQSFFETRTALRDWMETRMQDLGQDGEFQFAGKLNQELKDAKLVCPQCDAAISGFADATGYVGEIRLIRKGALLQATTQVGVQCGFDETAYLYKWDNGKWRRIIDSAKTAGPDGKYEPQRIDQIQFTTPTNRSDHQMILVLSEFPGCSAKWRPVFFRLWNLPLNSDTATLLLDERAVSPVEDRRAPIAARLSDNDLLLRYEVASIDPKVGSRMRIGHYRLNQGKMDRIIPYVLTPRDFIEEWVTDPWSAAALMSGDPPGPALEAQHEHLYSDHVRADFVDATSRCTGPGDRYQLHVVFHPSPQKDGEDRFVRIHWIPPYLFEMTEITDHADAKCTEIDPRIDYRMTMPGLR